MDVWDLLEISPMLNCSPALLPRDILAGNVMFLASQFLSYIFLFTMTMNAQNAGQGGVRGEQLI